MLALQKWSEWKWSDVWPSMVTHTRNLCSAFNPSMCTHTVLNTHPEQWAANAAAPGEQLGVRCLAQGSPLSRGIEGGESAGYSLPPPTIPAGPETRTRNLRVTSPTLYPLGHNCSPKVVQGCISIHTLIWDSWNLAQEHSYCLYMLLHFEWS